MAFVDNQANGGFVTGANAIIKWGETVVGVARDLSYNISIPHIPIEAMGTLEVIANEPVSFTVSGSFSLYRYNKKIAGTLGTSASDTGNTVAAYNQTSQVNPGEILFSRAFDLTIQLKDNNCSADGKDTPKVENLDEGTSLFNYMQFKNCRITNRSSSLDKRGVQVERYDFVAIIGGDLNPTGDSLGLTDSQWVTDGQKIAATPPTTP